MCWAATIFAARIETCLSSEDWTVIFDKIYWSFLLFENPKKIDVFVILKIEDEYKLFFFNGVDRIIEFCKKWCIIFFRFCLIKWEMTNYYFEIIKFELRKIKIIMRVLIWAFLVYFSCIHLANSLKIKDSLQKKRHQFFFSSFFGRINYHDNEHIG